MDNLGHDVVLTDLVIWMYLAFGKNVGQIQLTVKAIAFDLGVFECSSENSRRSETFWGKFGHQDVSKIGVSLNADTTPVAELKSNI